MPSDESSPSHDHATAPARVVFCITDLETGGAERSLVELVLRLDRNAFDPVVYCLGPRPASNARSLPKASLVDTLEKSGVRVYCFGARHPVQLVSVLWKLRRQLVFDAPRLVQSFLFHANVTGALAARLAGVRHVVTGIRVAERRAGWHLTLARWTDRWVDRHVCVSQDARDFSIREGGLDATKLVVIPNGVDAARFAGVQPCPRASLGVPDGRRIILHAGRLDEQKGVDWLVELMPSVFDRCPDCDLVLVGEGPERRRIERLAAELGIENRVHFAGFRDDVAEILAASDLFVLASRWEGMPNAILEAMAAGKPIVATSVEGVVEALGPLAADQVVPPLDSQAFADKVVATLADSALLRRLGLENRERAQTNFSLDAVADAYERLYESLLASEE
jgi:glycosyltransferase involved in cell wall biosynthesis